MITAIIPARAGSKRLLDKNIKKLAGRPLIFYTIDTEIDFLICEQVLKNKEKFDDK